MDTTALKERIDLRLIVESDLGRPVSRGGRAWSFRCPFHQEHKGAALAVWPNGWRCFGACNEGGDAISWMVKRFSLTFKEAVEALGGELDGKPLPKAPKPAPALTFTEPPPPEWQYIAKQIIERAIERLWKPEGIKARDYLGGKRGLKGYTMQIAELGLIPGGPNDWYEYKGLKIPAGITIPWTNGDEIWGIKVRRAAGPQRYQQVSGGRLADGLYLADHLVEHFPTLIVEGEFNALSGLQHLSEYANVVSLGTSGSSLNPRWFPALCSSPVIYALFDDDPAGHKGAERLRSLSQRVHPIRLPPGYKDLNEFSAVSPDMNAPLAVEDWFWNILNPVEEQKRLCHS